MSKKHSKELDKETQKVVTYSEKLKALTQHEGWVIVKDKLLKEIANLMTINDMVTQSDPLTIIQIIAAKKRAADILLNWLRDIEGTVAQADGNQSVLDKLVEDFIINEDNLG
jgi:hypothetical protein